LQQEVHKDPSTLTILYTLTYVPWGFVKTIGQTSTSYYYLYDQRGNTRGITDAQGTILETYHYSPYGILLSTPSISQPHFLSGNAQCQYEAESSLYYMHARYYDAHTGRFLTKDALPGSMSSPLSQNRYTYCQNDPITLIDPTGNSPENTGNPPRMSGPHANPSSDPCVLPDVAGDSGAVHFSGMGIPGKMEIQKPNPAMVIGGTSPGVLTAGYDACGGYDAGGIYRWDDISSQLTDEEKDAGFVHKYELVINGILVYIYEKEDGTLSASPKSGGFFEDGTISLESAALAIGLNMAFGKITGEGLSVGNVGAFLSGLVSFARENLGTFMNIVGGGLSGLTQFMKHATIGYVVASEMQKYFNSDYNEYDMIFGFWTSFWTDTLGLDIPILPTYKGRPGDDIPLSLVDIANISKAIAYQETRINPNSFGENDYSKAGMMQVNYGGGWEFTYNTNIPDVAKNLHFYHSCLEFYGAFNNIGIGIA
jgi:RHS repeat-associated protein